MKKPLKLVRKLYFLEICMCKYKIWFYTNQPLTENEASGTKCPSQCNIGLEDKVHHFSDLGLLSGDWTVVLREIDLSILNHTPSGLTLYILVECTSRARRIVALIWRAAVLASRRAETLRRSFSVFSDPWEQTAPNAAVAHRASNGAPCEDRSMHWIKYDGDRGIIGDVRASVACEIDELVGRRWNFKEIETLWRIYGQAGSHRRTVYNDTDTY